MVRRSRYDQDMNRDDLLFWVTIASGACWIICFWWMHSISAKQNRLLKQLGEQAARIESLSKVEHDLIREVHPQVAEIKEGVQNVKAVVEEKI